MKIILDTEPLIMLLLFRFYSISKEKQKQYKVKKILEKRLYLEKKYWNVCFDFFARELRNRHIFVTSYVLAEATNIIEKEYFKGEDYRRLLEISADFFKNLYEKHIEKDAIIDTMIEKRYKEVKAGNDSKYFIEFGFADISIYLALTRETDKNNSIEVFLLSEDKYLINFCTYVEKFKNVMTFNEFVNRINERYRFGYSLIK